jgi:hypothetical protein
VNVGAYEAPEPVEPPPVSRVIEEGLLIAESAVRMAVKNRIIVSAVRDQNDYDAAEYAKVAQNELSFAMEQNFENSERVVIEREAAVRSRGAATHEHDYGWDDRETLRRRRAVYEGLAAELRAWRDDPERVAALVEDARLAAWADISASLETRLVDPLREPEAPTADETLEHDDRVALLLQDLDDLGNQGQGQWRA